jgi:hypothetical protein
MPVCPQCQHAYPVGAVDCETCGTRLVKSPPPDPNQGQLFEVVELFDLPDEITGMALKTFLADQGIEVNVRELQASFYGITLNPGGGIWGKLVVAKEYESQARALVKEFLKEFPGR